MDQAPAGNYESLNSTESQACARHPALSLHRKEKDLYSAFVLILIIMINRFNILFPQSRRSICRVSPLRDFKYEQF